MPGAGAVQAAHIAIGFTGERMVKAEPNIAGENPMMRRKSEMAGGVEGRAGFSARAINVAE
jgi:hypothetical protein